MPDWLDGGRRLGVGGPGAAFETAPNDLIGLAGESRLGMTPGSVNSEWVGLGYGVEMLPLPTFDGGWRPLASQVELKSSSISSLNSFHSPCPSCRCCVSRVRFSGSPKKSVLMTSAPLCRSPSANECTSTKGSKSGTTALRLTSGVLRIGGAGGGEESLDSFLRSPSV